MFILQDSMLLLFLLNWKMYSNINENVHAKKWKDNFLFVLELRCVCERIFVIFCLLGK